MIPTSRPEADEYAPTLASYVARVDDDDDVVHVLGRQLGEFGARLKAIPEARGDHRYEAGKWSIKEVVGHLSDTERIFAYRALHVARGDPTPLLRFDDQAYVLELRAERRSLADFAAEWAAVRRASIALFQNLPAPAWLRRGVASDQPISVRALAFVIAGHLRHHVEVLEARYGA